ncbi:hypothetical protein ACFYPX_19210 [Micromonospora zamorensis]|uniref:hypothetical protein n=1 Tax=Micromonospora zamorensis TaxID=709883 RepID=UPI00368E4B5A
MEIATSMSPDAGEQRPGADVSCSDRMIPFLSARRLTGTPSAMAAATLSDSVLVRTGTTLVVVQEQGNKPGDDTFLFQIAEAALRRYQTTGS